MLNRYQAVVFLLLLTNRTFGDPFSGEPDEDQPLIDRLNEYVENVHTRVIQSTGYERLRVVVNTSGELLDFFKFMGYLLLNGTLGECVDGVRTFTGNGCVIHMSQNRSRFGDEVVDFLAEDRDDNLKDVENFSSLVLPKWGSAWDANATMPRSYLKWIFFETWNFFGHIQGHIAEAHPVDDDGGWYRELPWKCYKFTADERRYDDDTINALIDLVGPKCDNLECSSRCWVFKDKLQRECETFSDKHDFNGGTSNRCFHKFIIRYNNYSTEAYETFIGHVAKYLYWDTIAHGLCLSIERHGKIVNVTEADRRKEWMMRNLATIGDSLLEVDSIFAEMPPPYWIVEAKGVMEKVIGNETVPYPSPTDAVHLYKRIHDRFQSDVRKIPALQIKNLSDCQIDALVYYTAYDSTEHCYRNMTNIILSGQFSGVNYVVSLRHGSVPSWITSENATMERYFGNSAKSDQCERIDDVDRKMENKLSDTLCAFVAVKCARRFVWYELGYQYFPAAYTEAPNVQIKQASTYDSNCGMTVLFP